MFMHRMELIALYVVIVCFTILLLHNLVLLFFLLFR